MHEFLRGRLGISYRDLDLIKVVESDLGTCGLEVVEVEIHAFNEVVRK